MTRVRNTSNASAGVATRSWPRLVADTGDLTLSNLPARGLPGRGLLGQGLGKSFKRRPVLRGVDISVERGEVVGLLGPNGAGKTTCFYIITGLIAADTGVVSLDGRDITDLPMYRRARLGIGYLPQEASIFRGLTVEQNIRAILEDRRAEAGSARGDARSPAGGVFDHASQADAGGGTIRRRAAALRNRPSTRQSAALHPARRTAGWYRSDRGR